MSQLQYRELNELENFPDVFFKSEASEILDVIGHFCVLTRLTELSLVKALV